MVELIVVVIVLSILATIAIPKLYRNVEHSRVGTAMSTLSHLRQEMERCGSINANIFTTCTKDFISKKIDFDDDMDAAWDYQVTVTGSEKSYYLTATRTSGIQENTTVVLYRNGTIGGSHPGREDFY